MSRFSGKCDFCDEIEIVGLDEILNAEVYVGDSKEPLKLTCLADCIPYYPYVISVSSHTDGKLYIRLTSKSWVDISEDRYGHMRMHDYYRKVLEEELKNASVGNKTPDF